MYIDYFHHHSYEEMGTANTLMHHFMGTSVVLADGQDWQKQRPIINMAFSRLKPTTAAAEATKHMIGLLRDKMDQPLDIDPFMRRAMFRSLLIAIFDLPELLENDYDQYVSHTMDTLFAQALHPLYMMFPLMDRPWNPLRRKLFEQSTEFNQLINSITEKKREQLLREGPSEDKDRDLLTLMLQASMDPENAKLTDYELLGNIKALFLAGHETTATAMTLLMHLLAIHQDVQDKVREEVFRVLGCGPGALTTPTPDQQRDLEYLNAVVKECQRLYGPTAKLMPRITSQDVTLDDGTVLPKGTGITVDQMAILRSDKVWTNPEQFRPERHLDTREGRTPAEFITFSAGRRICPGMNLATVEQRVMLALCVQMFSWELGDAVNGQDIQIANTFILHPKNTVLKLHLLD
jgi:cytochrome P450